MIGALLQSNPLLLPYLSELAGLLVVGLNIQTFLKALYKRYIQPTLNGVNISNNLQTKCPPKRQKKIKNKTEFKR